MDHTLGHDVTLEVVPVESMDESNNESSLGFLAGFSRGQLFFGCVFCVLLMFLNWSQEKKKLPAKGRAFPRQIHQELILKTFISKTC